MYMYIGTGITLNECIYIIQEISNMTDGHYVIDYDDAKSRYIRLVVFFVLNGVRVIYGAYHSIYTY